MIVVRRRLIFWLLKAYLRRWGKTILLCFGIGIAAFFFLRQFPLVTVLSFAKNTKETIGVVGAYTVDSLPPSLLSEISVGLTQVTDTGAITPGVASSWEVRDEGKTYVFHLRKTLRFADGTPVDASRVGYNFKDVKKEIPDAYTVIYKLKDAYAPFLVTVSRPIFKDVLVGIGDYKVSQLKLNGNFIEFIELKGINGREGTKKYLFYPTHDALKTAYALGEVNHASGLADTTFADTSFESFTNTSVTKVVEQDHLVTIFFNTKDATLSDKKIREALTYALPNEFSYGKRNMSPIPRGTWAYQDVSIDHAQDIEHAKNLLSSSSATDAAKLVLTLQVLPKYQKTAEIVRDSWGEIGLNTKIEVTQGKPDRFQMFLGDFDPPKDPDQYTLWHSNQNNNITGYANPRIDLLLEQGRKITDQTKRTEIYADFQKYLLADAPATFLYFPYEYDVKRK